MGKGSITFLASHGLCFDCRQSKGVGYRFPGGGVTQCPAYVGPCLAGVGQSPATGVTLSGYTDPEGRYAPTHGIDLSLKNILSKKALEKGVVTA